jgi:hypothetical protein
MSDDDSKIVFNTEPIQKSDTLQIHISINQFKKYEYIDMREFYLQKESNNYLPTQKGITISTDFDLNTIKEIRDNFDKVIEYLEKETEKEETKK